LEKMGGGKKKRNRPRKHSYQTDILRKKKDKVEGLRLKDFERAVPFEKKKPGL